MLNYLASSEILEKNLKFSLFLKSYDYILEEKMCPLIASLNRSFKAKKHRVRCISIQNLRDTDEIELEMKNHSLIVVFFKEFKIKKPMDAKRFLQCLNAFIRQYSYDILNLGRLDYFLLLSKEFNLATDTL